MLDLSASILMAPVVAPFPFSDADALIIDGDSLGWRGRLLGNLSTAMLTSTQRFRLRERRRRDVKGGANGS
jgi:hypothetical protein